MPQVPGSAVRALRPPKKPLERAAAALGPVVTESPVPVPARPAVEEPQELNVVGPRKLIRPRLPEGAFRDRRFSRRDEPVLQWITGSTAMSSAHESSHAEAFYFQKQMQTQTPMVFVLEDGESIEGCIEWYDRNAIKVRCTSIRTSGPRASDAPTRALIYKSSIKYLYKSGENQPQL
ncbi:MAG TPA: hypothetical protein VMD92_12570 [Acidobacteriaceae bacterium]|jgi:hypothetical protein|nr:hypothetical protein [Acidobacteriaceae bacterium]